MLGTGDAGLVMNAAPGVFDHPVGRELVDEFLNDPRHHLVAAIDGGRVVGFVSAIHYINPDKPPELWINEVGVAPEYQQRGIGARMLAAALDLARGLGCESAWVLTDNANTAAIRLYESAGGTASSVPSVLFEFAIDHGQDRR